MGEFLRDFGVWLYNFYFLALVFVVRQVWFLLSLGGFLVVMLTALKEERYARQAQRIGGVPRYSTEGLRRTRR